VQVLEQVVDPGGIFFLPMERQRKERQNRRTVMA
jgi:hypothetical protein